MDFDLLIDDIDETAFSTTNDKTEAIATHPFEDSPKDTHRSTTKYTHQPRKRITAPDTADKEDVTDRKTSRFTHKTADSRKSYNRTRRSPKPTSPPPRANANFQLKRRTTDRNEVEGRATAYTWYLADGIEPVKNILKECREEALLTPTTSYSQEAQIRESWTLTAFCLYPLYRKRPKQCNTSIP